MEKLHVLAGIPFLLVAGVCAGCRQDEVKVIDVPRKDIPQEILNKPIPPEAFKNMSPVMRKQLKKMEETVSQVTDEKSNPEP
jgi:hypothetical protein